MDASTESGHRPEGYDALVQDAGAYEDRRRLVFRVDGARALGALHGLVTADLEAVGDGDAAFPSLILTPKGRVMADAVIISCAGVVLLDVPRAAWPELEAHFGRYLPPRLARLEPAGLRPIRIRGPGALDRESHDPALARLDGPVYSERDGTRWDVVPFDGGFAARRYDGIDLYVPTDVAPGPDIPVVSEEAWEIWRIERGVPVYGIDISQENLPQETGLVAERVSFVKGCYTGQEVLARIHYRGKVNRHLRGVRLGSGAGDDGPAGQSLAAGDVLTVDGKEVGSLTSAARSPAFGWIALGYVRRENEPGDLVMVEGVAHAPVPARVAELPFTDAQALS